MAREVDAFKRDLKNFIQNTQATSVRLGEIMREKFTQEFIEKTPVDTGRAKAGWKFVPATRSVQEAVNVNTPIFRIRAIVLQNDVFYTPTMFTYPGTNRSTRGLEGGRSDQAPNGIVGPGVEQILNDWDAIVRRSRIGEDRG